MVGEGWIRFWISSFYDKRILIFQTFGDLSLLHFYLWKPRGVTVDKRETNARNMLTQQPLARISNVSLKNLTKIDNFSKLFRRQVVLVITGRVNTIKKKKLTIRPTVYNNPNGKLDST